MKELSLHILDIAQNSVKAGATCIDILLEQMGSRLTITVSDNGCGMSEAFLKTVEDPFTTTRTTRKVGMGIPLFKLAAEQTGGSISIASKEKRPGITDYGTTITATFFTDHVDCAPLGDITSTVVTLLQGNPQVRLTYTRRTDDGEVRLSTDEMRSMLGEIPLNEPDVLAWVRDYLSE